MSDLEPRQDHQAERELAREFMREILQPESKTSPDLQFVDNWEAKANAFLQNVKVKYKDDEETVTALMAILVNASKALADQAKENPSSPVRHVADQLFEYIRSAALIFSSTLRDAVAEKRSERFSNLARRDSSSTTRIDYEAAGEDQQTSGEEDQDRGTLLDIL